MIEDDQTIEEMRSRVIPEKAMPRSFMSATELLTTRTMTLRVTQAKLIEQLINPSTGIPISSVTLYFWEKGLRPVPLWAARRVRDLAEAAKRYDSRKGA